MLWCCVVNVVAEKMMREQLGLDDLQLDPAEEVQLDPAEEVQLDPAEEGEEAPTEGHQPAPVAPVSTNTSMPERFVPYHRTLVGAAGIAARDARSSQVDD